MYDGSNWQKVNTGSSAANTGFPPGGWGSDLPDFEPFIVPIPGLFSPTQRGEVPLSSGGTTNFHRADGQWVPPPTSGAASASIRSSNIQSSSAATFTVSFPAGAAAGDMVLILAGSGFGFTIPVGWTYLDHA